MTAAEKEKIRDQVKKEISVLERSVETLTELTGEEVQSDANDWFTTKESNPSMEINEMALSKARQRLIVLSNVLKRIDSPDFGICNYCHKPIPFERMMAVPATTRCMSC